MRGSLASVTTAWSRAAPFGCASDVEQVARVQHTVVRRRIKRDEALGPVANAFGQVGIEKMFRGFAQGPRRLWQGLDSGGHPVVGFIVALERLQRPGLGGDRLGERGVVLLFTRGDLDLFENVERLFAFSREAQVLRAPDRVAKRLRLAMLELDVERFDVS